MALARSTTPRLGCIRPSLAATVQKQQQQQRQRLAFRQAAAASTSAHPSPSQSSFLAPRLPPGSTPNALPTRMKPASPSFYTAKPSYVDSMILLEDLARRTKRALELHAVPLDLQAAAKGVNAARRSLSWPKLDEMGRKLGIPLKSGQYRHIVARLSALARYRYFVQEYLADGSCGEQNRRLAVEVEQTLQNFNREGARADGQGELQHHASFLSASSGVDELGRAYARGRRKESSARVWIVPAHDMSEANPQTTISTSVLVNAQPVSAYFSRASDREAIMFPLRLTGLAGVFNVFALTRGGGTTGQTGAIAHGLARAIVSFYDDKARKVEDVEGLSSPAAKPLRAQADNIRRLLGRTGALLRDRRMVERKKTGKAKSRKSYTWVKR